MKKILEQLEQLDHNDPKNIYHHITVFSDLSGTLYSGAGKAIFGFNNKSDLKKKLNKYLKSKQ